MRRGDFLAWCVAGGIVGLNGSVASAAKVHAHAAADFTPGEFAGDPAQNPHPDSSGHGSWIYVGSLTSDPTDPAAGLMPLIWDTACVPEGCYDMGWTDGYCDYPLAFRSPGKPVKMHPSSSRYAVVRWTSSSAGPVSISGNFRKFDTIGNGDGVEVFVYVDGELEFHEQVANEDDVGVDFGFRADVYMGTTVDFVVGPDGPGDEPLMDADTTYVTATILSCPQDVNVDGTVDIQDFLELLAWWGLDCLGF
ncbi:MAG: hypothetical protein ACYTGY_11560 [Planctomycetota bacterium]